MSVTAVEYIEFGDGDEIGVTGTRNQARAQIASLAGVDYVRVKVRRAWLRRCDCEACLAGHSDDFHGYDEFWIHCEKSHPNATAWWLG